MADAKISPYSLNDLKNTTDDALGNYLRGLHFQQDHTKLDVRLGIGYVSVFITAAIFLADYKYGWEATKTWTAVAVVAYTGLSAAYSYWMWAVETGCVFEGRRDGRKISIASKTKKHEPNYYLTVTSTLPNSTPSSWQIRAPFTAWFTADGYFVAQPLQKWLATSIEVIGDADPKNASRDERDELATPATSNGSVNASGADTASKGSKRSKRKG